VRCKPQAKHWPGRVKRGGPNASRASGTATASRHSGEPSSLAGLAEGTGSGASAPLQASVVTALAITRWILIRTLRSPLGWGLLCVSALAWPALQRFTPIGITTASEDGARLAYEVAFLAALVGALLGLRALESIQSVLQRAADFPRWRAELSALAVSSAGWALVACALPLFSGGMGEGRRPALLIGIGLASIHLAALGVLLLRARLPAGVRSLGLLLLAWWIPSILGTSSHLGRWTSALLDIAATLRPPPEGWSPTALAARLGPMMGLCLVAWWLTGTRDRESQSPS
jgi:hypothetical protein